MNWPGYRPKTRRSRDFADCESKPAARLRWCRVRSFRDVACAWLTVLTSGLAAWAVEKPFGNLFYHPSAGFQIPFEIDPADKPFVKSIELYVSSDLGKSWRLSTATTPNSKAFKFRATGDGEYWFAVRTLDVEGRYNPSDDKPIVPGWRVVVDSKKPGLGLRSVARRGTMATVAWDARDENLDLSTFVLEFSIPGSGEWKPVPISRPVPGGESTWDCGTAESIRVRATVSDKAGNVQIAETQFGDGAAQYPTPDSSRSAADIDGQAPAPIARMASAAGDRRGILGPQDPLSDRAGAGGEWIDTPRAYGPESMRAATRGSESGRVGGGGFTGESREAGRPSGRESMPRRQMPILNSPRFPMNYVVEDAGPNGPATVELWVTRDGGRNWSRWAEDDDRVSPMMVDLGGEGVFGLSIVARSLAGQGDEIPRAGTVPQISVEIDSTPPAMILNVIKVGVGSQSGKVLISWQAEDRNFSARPIGIFYRPETANQWIPIAESLENTGQYVWTPGPQVPPVFHIRIEAIDLAGNRSSVDTTQYEPVLLDRSRPKGRILGINSIPTDTSGPIVSSTQGGEARGTEAPISARPAHDMERSGPANTPVVQPSKPAGKIESIPSNSGTSLYENDERTGLSNLSATAEADTPGKPRSRSDSDQGKNASQAGERSSSAAAGDPPGLPGDNSGEGIKRPVSEVREPGRGLQSVPPSASAAPSIAPPAREMTPAHPGGIDIPAVTPPGEKPDSADSSSASTLQPGDFPSPKRDEAPAQLPPSEANDPKPEVLPLSLDLPD